MSKRKSTASKPRRPALVQRAGGDRQSEKHSPRSALMLPENVRLDLIGVRAAVVTAMAALQVRSGIDYQMATMLHRSAVAPLDALLGDRS